MQPPGLIDRITTTWQAVERALQAAQAPAQWLARLYMAQVFFLAGLTKLRDWDTTLFLFTEEYRVPLLPPAVAAWSGTAGELILPVLLLLGLGGRLAALGLSVVNVVAVLSLADIPPAALQQHLTWGALLGALVLFGNGPWTLDHWLSRRRAVRMSPLDATARGLG
ncbi:MAG: DoxX family membrane protein [Hydrogenophaga sp.]|jgi:putative oxidoreductase|nr:DoxX family membrane protein [Hydrogenophaga sp.]